MIFRPFLPTSSALRHLRRPGRVSTPAHGRCQHQPPCLRRPAPAARAALRPFSTTRDLHDDPTHYETLGVSPTVSVADLKKRFYVLSRETHPDLHPEDPAANSRFQAISESYSVLGNPDKRQRYDRDVMGLRAQVRGNEGRGGTYAGSRPASGLSRRRSAFKGPPPSYFRHRGGTDGGAASSDGGQSGAQQGSPGSGGSAAWEGNYGPASSFAQSGDFDSSPVYKTQTIEDVRRERRREAAAQAAISEMEQEGDFWAKFVIVTVVVVGGVSMGSLVVSMWDTPNGGGLVKGDGTLRKSGLPGRGRESERR